MSSDQKRQLIAAQVKNVRNAPTHAAKVNEYRFLEALSDVNSPVGQSLEAVLCESSVDDALGNCRVVFEASISSCMREKVIIAQAEAFINTPVSNVEYATELRFFNSLTDENSPVSEVLKASSKMVDGGELAGSTEQILAQCRSMFLHFESERADRLSARNAAAIDGSYYDDEIGRLTIAELMTEVKSVDGQIEATKKKKKAGGGTKSGEKGKGPSKAAKGSSSSKGGKKKAATPKSARKTPKTARKNSFVKKGKATTAKAKRTGNKRSEGKMTWEKLNEGSKKWLKVFR